METQYDEIYQSYNMELFPRPIRMMILFEMKYDKSNGILCSFSFTLVKTGFSHK